MQRKKRIKSGAEKKWAVKRAKRRKISSDDSTPTVIDLLKERDAEVKDSTWKKIGYVILTDEDR